MNSIDTQYQVLLQSILDYGVEKSDRTGTGTKSIFGYTIRHRMNEGFPLLTTKKMPWKTLVTELLWFLRGDTNIKYLLDNGCNIWTGDAYKSYREPRPNDKDAYTVEEFVEAIKTNPEFAAKYGELGPIYGAGWRRWNAIDRSNFINTDNIDDPLLGNRGVFYGTQDVDQIATLINTLKANPDSRRLMVSAWNVGELPYQILPPCHYGFQVYTRELTYEEKKAYMDKHFSGKAQLTLSDFEKFSIPSRAISLMWNQRSVDTFLGLPFNIASYALLLTILAKEVNMVPDELIGNLGDTHLYLNHIEQAKEQIERDSYELPSLWINDLRSDTNTILGDITKWSAEDFKIKGYKCHPTIKAPLSN
jgi:thymidylate synthase